MAKHHYSIYQKMIARNVGFDDIYDLMGIRVLVDSVRDCYAALGTLHARWIPSPGGSRTTSRCRSSTCTSRCTPRSSARTASQWSCRSAPGACTSARNTGSRHTGSTRRRPPSAAAPRTSRTTPRRWRGCGSSSTGSARARTRPSSSSRCASSWLSPRFSSVDPSIEPVWAALWWPAFIDHGEISYLLF